MDHYGLSQQVLLEHQTLANVAAALRTTIGWSYDAADLSRKLSSLMFVGKSYKRHFRRLLALEEEGGYLAVVLESRPELADEVAALHQQHAQFRKALARVLVRLRRVDATDHAAFAAICGDLIALLDTIDRHNQRENGLLQEALLRDEGGEG